MPYWRFDCSSSCQTQSSGSLRCFRRIGQLRNSYEWTGLSNRHLPQSRSNRVGWRADISKIYFPSHAQQTLPRPWPQTHSISTMSSSFAPLFFTVLLPLPLHSVLHVLQRLHPEDSHCTDRLRLQMGGTREHIFRDTIQLLHDDDPLPNHRCFRWLLTGRFSVHVWNACWFLAK